MVTPPPYPTVRSCLAPASGGGSPPAFGDKMRVRHERGLNGCRPTDVFSLGRCTEGLPHQNAVETRGAQNPEGCFATGFF
jgi:hypothetical protein